RLRSRGTEPELQPCLDRVGGYPDGVEPSRAASRGAARTGAIPPVAPPDRPDANGAEVARPVHQRAQPAGPGGQRRHPHRTRPHADRERRAILLRAMADAPPVELLDAPPGNRIAPAPRVPAGRLQPRSGRRRHRLGPRAMGRNPRRTSSLRRADRIVQPDTASRDAGETEPDEPRSMETFLRIRSRTLDPLVCRSRSESAGESTDGARRLLARIAQDRPRKPGNRAVLHRPQP